MGKVSPVSTKYVIYTHIEIEGLVDKPDVIGAIFGQTEGFLGQDLELRELQRSGKVGRIEVKSDNVNGKSTGQIIIPCSLDKAETAIIAASLETIERIGPCNARVKVEKIEDVRVSKRASVIARAKELLLTLQSSVLPDSLELTEEVSQAVRVMEVMDWGPEKLPAGPDVESSEEIIVVEGRADVINLLKCGFKNAIAINGTSLPESIKDLCRRKTTTVFVDGDRGGDLIIKELLEGTEVDYITKAPAGKEVEELTKKEIHISLRARAAAEQFKFEVSGAKKPQFYQPPSGSGSSYGNRRPMGMRDNRDMRESREPSRDMPPRENRVFTPREPQQNNFAEKQAPVVDKKVKDSFKAMLDDLMGTRGACILDKDYNVLGKVPAAEVEVTVKAMGNVFAIVFDGAVTKEVASAADSSRVSYIVATTSKIRPNEAKAVILTGKDL